ncbi:MAG: L-histidine N(alpha)-methyltransferase [Verrucomicrobia bacterium]|nr:MAG: L-histidine N(alpha)-methyltransferase [Verrucomicrobiota bacterium]
MSFSGAGESVWAGPALSTECFRRDVLAGLSKRKKTLPCKYLYDESGARLFEEICELEEYYLTRTELGVLERNIAQIAGLLGPRANLVELGSGNCLKTCLLLDHLDQPASYSPVDVAHPQLLDCSDRLSRAYPGLAVEPVCADYTHSFSIPAPPAGSGRTTFFFPGSTLGNFEPEDAVSFLRRIARLCSPAGGLLVGIDLKKSPQILNAAYNDAQNVTAQFNLNLLARINRELQGGFDLEQFQHRAIYNASAGRIEMHLISCRKQTVAVDGHRFAFTKGESTVTEHSYKYTMNEFRRLAARGGLEVANCWTDERSWFSVQYLVPRKDRT